MYRSQCNCEAWAKLVEVSDVWCIQGSRPHVVLMPLRMHGSSRPCGVLSMVLLGIAGRHQLAF